MTCSINRNQTTQKSCFSSIKPVETLTAVAVFAITCLFVVTIQLAPYAPHPQAYLRGFRIKILLPILKNLPTEMEYPQPLKPLHGFDALVLNTSITNDYSLLTPLFEASSNCTFANAKSLESVRMATRRRFIQNLNLGSIAGICLLPACGGSQIRYAECIELQKLFLRTFEECFIDRVLMPYYPFLSNTCPRLEWDFGQKILEIGTCASKGISSSEIRGRAMHPLQEITYRFKHCEHSSLMPSSKENDTQRIEEYAQKAHAYYQTLTGDFSSNYTSYCKYSELSINGPDKAECVVSQKRS